MQPVEVTAEVTDPGRVPDPNFPACCLSHR